MEKSVDKTTISHQSLDHGSQFAQDFINFFSLECTGNNVEKMLLEQLDDHRTYGGMMRKLNNEFTRYLLYLRLEKFSTYFDIREGIEWRSEKRIQLRSDNSEKIWQYINKNAAMYGNYRRYYYDKADPSTQDSMRTSALDRFSSEDMQLFGMKEYIKHSIDTVGIGIDAATFDTSTVYYADRIIKLSDSLLDCGLLDAYFVLLKYAISKNNKELEKRFAKSIIGLRASSLYYSVFLEIPITDNYYLSTRNSSIISTAFFCFPETEISEYRSLFDLFLGGEPEEIKHTLDMLTQAEEDYRQDYHSLQYLDI